MKSRQGSRIHGSSLASPLVRLWLLRLLIPLGCHRKFIQLHGVEDDALAEAVGMQHWIDRKEDEYNKPAALTELRKRHAEAERQKGAGIGKVMSRNIKRLATLVGLSELDCRILEFVVLLHNERVLDDAADMLGSLSSVKMHRVLAVLLDLPEPAIRASLSPVGTLARSGLVSVTRDATFSLRNKLDLLSPGFAEMAQTVDADPVNLLRDVVILSDAPHLKITDYEHIRNSLRILRPYLKRAYASRRRGVNVFLHGPPGTGKNQLAKILAQELGCELFEIASGSENGDPVDGEQRLRAYRAAQSFFAQRRALMLFDEVEDVFCGGEGLLGRLFGARNTAHSRKAWINRALEENPVPTLWLSNSVSGLNPAFVRRFDMIISLRIPPKRQRERIIHEACGDILTKRSIARLAEADTLAPAVITRAASVVRAINDDLPDAAKTEAIEHLVSNTLEAQGHKALRNTDATRSPDYYDPAFIHTQTDLTQITQGLVHVRKGRLCLYGPPGTGKTAYGRWLADQIGLPLIVKRGSDLISMWVGETEKNIAQAFREAEDEQALLLIDEVDSFLRDRRGAVRTFEVTAVNEMLTQMESFSGVFIASTNLMGGLDQAALRRFDLKVKFDYLRADQAWQLLCRQCAALSIPLPEERLMARLDRLTVLTPGDFAAIARQHRFRPITAASSLIDALEDECSVKEDHPKKRMGFL